MPYEDVLLHRATPLRTTEEGDDDDDFVEGEPDETPDGPGTPFDCCLFLPLAAEAGNVPRGRRQVRRPTLLMADVDDAGAPVVLTIADEVDVTAPELTGASAVRWQVEAGPQPFGAPGDEIIGSQVTLKRVED